MDDVPLDLNYLTSTDDWEVLEARDINDSGIIVGHGRNRLTGKIGALRLTP